MFTIFFFRETVFSDSARLNKVAAACIIELYALALIIRGCAICSSISDAVAGCLNQHEPIACHNKNHEQKKYPGISYKLH